MVSQSIDPLPGFPRKTENWSFHPPIRATGAISATLRMLEQSCHRSSNSPRPALINASGIFVKVLPGLVGQL